MKIGLCLVVLVLCLSLAQAYGDKKQEVVNIRGHTILGQERRRRQETSEEEVETEEDEAHPGRIICKIVFNGKVIKDEDCPEGECSSNGKSRKYKVGKLTFYRCVGDEVPKERGRRQETTEEEVETEEDEAHPGRTICKIERDGKVIKDQDCPEGDCIGKGKRIKQKGKPDVVIFHCTGDDKREVDMTRRQETEAEEMKLEEKEKKEKQQESKKKTSDEDED